MGTKSTSKQKHKRKRLSAAVADRHWLYEDSVQDTESDIRFIVRAFRKKRDREPSRLREDFCGTAKLCANWVRRKPQRSAVGLDLHRPTLDYGLRRHLQPLGNDGERVTLLERDVLQGTSEKFDLILAFNFSYSVFKRRQELLDYFRVVRRDLSPDGAFFLDLYGGPEAQIEIVETQKMSGYTYVWDQKALDAVSGFGKRYIHFRFPDGTKMKRAFTYDWRLWTLPELRDLLEEAGFAASDVYWEDADDDGEGTGVFRKVRRAENEESWIAYLVGWR